MFSLSIEEILSAARNAGASDVHLAAGLPPKMRVNGLLITMDYSRLTASDTLDILIRVMPQAQRDIFEDRGECDFSFSVPGCGRCRANAISRREAWLSPFIWWMRSSLLRKIWRCRVPLQSSIEGRAAWYW